MRLSAHLGYLYTDLPLERRVAAAAADGFTAVEHPAPFALPAKALRAELDQLGLTFAQLTSGMGDAARGEKGLAALPGRETEFREGFLRALDYALTLGCGFVHPMAGVPAPEAEGVDDTYAANLHWAAERLEGTPVQLLVEAIGPTAVPGYAMGRLAQAVAVQDSIGADRLRLLLDTFHAKAEGVDPAGWIVAEGGRIGHVHIADFPGRHEPGSGSLDFGAVLTALEASGFAGAIGFEYLPLTDTAASLGFLPEWTARLSSPAGVSL